MKIRVGILTAPKIEFERREDTFVLKNVRIGIGFHWDRREDQEFQGTLEIKPTPNPSLKGGAPWQVAINTIDLEDYLCSVISSEMNANSPMELLKAHAVISRSWALRAISQRPHEQIVNGQIVNDFDVCADDHCQRYEGLRRMNERAVIAVRETQGQVLISDKVTKDQVTKDQVRSGEWEICDCRYHKCCGGRTEIWRTCWEDIDVPYIQSVQCDWCDPQRKSLVHRTSVLRTSLNDYDQETRDFHDWQVRYTQEELSEIIRTKSGIDFGEILDLVPLKRGASGRIYELKIVGTKHTETIGKELKIRLWLSNTCLYSSWFEISRQLSAVSHQPSAFTLTGHGWGHGAGLCQIGAAVMASEGFSYDQILAHYYVGTRLSTTTR
ncbi:MAG: SpoIID/LytB domain-containing protein [Paludibacteraceae bacterium]|nr:SpoIID/LytB domain-containing protein [Paludibacteraceae bacterium]